MKSPSLLLSTSATVLIGAIAIAHRPAAASEAKFYCQSNAEVPSTVIKSDSGTEQSLFNWKLDPEKVSATPEELCNSVTQKLNDYVSAGNDLSSLTFRGSTVFNDDGDMTSLPAVCISSSEEPCKLPLFTLKPSANPSVASNVLNSILDPALQKTAVQSGDRGFQSTSYEVNFWDLLGL